MVGLKLSSDQNFANGGTLLRPLTTLDRAHLAGEFDFGRDLYTTRANSGTADGTAGASGGVYGGVPAYSPYSVELVSPKKTDFSNTRWFDTGVIDLGANYTIALIYNARSVANAVSLLSNSPAADITYGISMTIDSNGVLGAIFGKNTSSNANEQHLIGFAPGTPANAVRMSVLRVAGLTDTRVKLSGYRNGGLEGSVLDQTFTGFTATPGVSTISIGSTRGMVNTTYGPTVDIPADYYGAWIWADQAAMPSDAAILAFYNEQRARYDALGVTL
jgi:hypothetical protein